MPRVHHASEREIYMWYTCQFDGINMRYLFIVRAYFPPLVVFDNYHDGRYEGPMQTPPSPMRMPLESDNNKRDDRHLDEKRRMRKRRSGKVPKRNRRGNNKREY
ncbi:hypothetical protein VTJ04DRAFT_3222 [Mycothermus thermophilus]|uniref:uncharacterized protein n=1 Tax=Humicola insolens TaxID=85995 RepID=UPI00374237EC